jgi:hypothetical protein
MYSPALASKTTACKVSSPPACLLARLVPSGLERNADRGCERAITGVGGRDPDQLQQQQQQQ